MVKILNVELANKIFKIAWPAIVEYFMVSLYTLVDTFFIAKLGVSDVAALGGGGYIAWAFWVPGYMLTTGVMILVAQNLGAGKRKKAGEIFGKTLVLTLAISIPATILGILFAEKIVRIIVVDPEVTIKGSLYLIARLLGLPGMYVTFVISSALRGAKDTKTPMKISVLGNIFNVITDPLFIFGLLGFPKLGIFGAGITSAISFYFMLTLYVILKFRGKLTLSPEIALPSKEILENVVKLGLPVSIERILLSTLSLVYVSIVARFSSIALAALQIGLRIESLAFMPGIAFRIATATLVGHEVGARRIENGEIVAKTATRMSVAFMIMVGLLLALTSYYIPKLFISDVNVQNLSTIYLILAGTSEPGLGLFFAVSGAFHGAGNTIIPTVVNMLSYILVRLMLGYVLGRFFNLGVIGVWVGMFLDVYMKGIMLYILFRKKFESIARVLV